MTVYMEDVESIEFDNPFGADGTNAPNPGQRTGGDEAVYDDNNAPSSSQPRATPQPQTTSRPAPQTQQPADPGPQRGSAAPVFIPIRLKVDPKASESGWVSSGFTVRRGQRLRVTATGRITLTNGLSTTPTGLPRVNDTDKLLPNDPTGALIGVIGDDNNDFILLSSGQEFVARRDGILFLGINTGRLTTTGGAYEVVVEAEVLR
jgi:hypothetical protein